MSRYKHTYKKTLLVHSAVFAIAFPQLANAAQVSSNVSATPANAVTAPEAASDGQVTGIVKNAAGLFMTGAEVRLEGGDVVAVTDSDGRFTLRRVPAGMQRLRISYFGLETKVIDVAVAANETAQADIQLVAAAEEAGSDIVVSGSRPIAESEEAAIQFKRASTSLIDVVAADSIGRFPDQNVAASLSRLPGVGVARDQGQERYISLRGAPATWTTLAFDGVNVISPAGREARFDTIPSAIASKIIVRKAVTPDMTGETVAGNVNIVTRSPFDYPGLKVAGDMSYGYNDLGGGKQYNVGGYVSDRFFNDTFGVIVSASRYERDMVTDNFENSWEVAPEDQETGRAARIWNSNTQNKLYRLTRSNTSLSGRLEWRPDSNNEVFLSSIFTEFRDDELRNANVFDLDQDAVATNNTAQVSRTGYADVRTGNTPMKGTLYGAEVESTLNSSSSKQRIFTNTLGGKHTLGDWTVNWRGNFTRADNVGSPPFGSSWRSPTDFTRRPTIEYDFTDPNLSKVHLFDTIRNQDGSYSKGGARPYISPTELGFLGITRSSSLDRTDAYSGKLDLEHHLDLFGADTLFQFGGQYDRRTKTADRTVLETTAAMLTAAGRALPTQSDISIDDPFKGKIPLGYGFKYFSSDMGSALFDGYEAAGLTRVQPNTTELNNYKVTENVIAAYAMATTSFNWGNMVYGARVERVRNTGDALSQTDTGFTPTHVSSSATSIFPSLHFNYNMNSDMKLRLSFNTGAARPDYSNLRPNFSFDDFDQVVSGGNPRAKPERAKGIDLYYEWYMPSRGFFSAGIYYKKLNDILYDVELNTFGLDVLNVGGIDRSGYMYQTISNGGSGEIKGLEVAYVQPLEALARDMGLPDWMGGFGLRANFTLNDSKATTPDGRTTDLPGASDFLYNASVYYERFGLSARASWQYQSKYLDSLGSNPTIGDNYWASVGRLDVSLRYALNKKSEIYLDVNNLTDAAGIRFVGDASRPIEHETFGRRYLAGVRFNF